MPGNVDGQRKVRMFRMKGGKSMKLVLFPYETVRSLCAGDKVSIDGEKLCAIRQVLINYRCEQHILYGASRHEEERVGEQCLHLASNNCTDNFKPMRKRFLRTTEH